MSISKSLTIALGLLLLPSILKAEKKSSLRLVSARDHIEGFFLV